jgi:hypothetical protein
MTEINIDQLIKILPQLIRENDTVKGAIISALSGVVATKDDIKELIQAMDKRFEAMDKRFEAMEKRFEAMDKRFEANQQETNKRFEAMDKRFEANQQETNKRFEAMEKRFEANQQETNKRFESVEHGILELKAAVGSLGLRSGINLQDVILKLMQNQLAQYQIPYTSIQREFIQDTKGDFFFPGFSTDIDIVVKNEEVDLFEIKYQANNYDIFHFWKVAQLYESLHHRKPANLFLVVLEISKENVAQMQTLPITIIAGKIT